MFKTWQFLRCFLVFNLKETVLFVLVVFQHCCLQKERLLSEDAKKALYDIYSRSTDGPAACLAHTVASVEWQQEQLDLIGF